MPKKGFKSVTLKEEVYNNYIKIVRELNAASSTKIGLSEFMEWILEIFVDWSRKLPRLSKSGITKEGIAIYDSKDSNIIQVNIKDGSLYCRSCKSEECIHTGFSYALPEVNQLLNLTIKKKQIEDEDKAAKAS